MRWISRAAPAFAATLLALSLHFFRFGYSYASGDQDELLPLVLHRLDNSLFANDWFVVSQSGGIGVRTYAAGLLTYLAQVVPLWFAVLVVHLLSWMLVGFAVYHIALLLTRSRPTAMASVVIALVLTPQWTLGGNDLIHHVMVPSSLGWGFALVGLLLHLRQRPAAAGGLLGIATLFQALVGLQVMLVVAWDLVLRLRPKLLKTQWIPTLLTFASYAIVSAPILIPLVLSQSIPDSPTPSSPSLFYIVAEFRNPHHYLPTSFPLTAWIKFSFLVIAGGVGLFVLEQQRALRRAMFVRRAALLLVIMLGAGFMGTELLDELMIAKLQLFMTTVLWKVFFVAGAVAAVGRFVPLGQRLFAVMEARPARTIVVTVAVAMVVAVLAAAGQGSRYVRLRPVAHQETRLGQLEEWVRRSTPRDAIFLIPPSITTFRPNAQRAVVVNFKAFPFQPELSREWFNRLFSVAPARLPDRGGAAILDELDRAFSQQPLDRLVDVMERYDADYVLLPHEIHPGDDLQQVYRGGEWHLYRLNPGGAPRLADQATEPDAEGEASA